MVTQDEASRLAALTDEDLMLELGEAIAVGELPKLGARPPNRRAYIDKARVWIERNADKIATAVCGSAALRLIAESEADSREKLLKVIADAIIAVFTSVPAATLAEIILRDGVREYCRERWSTSA